MPIHINATNPIPLPNLHCGLPLLASPLRHSWWNSSWLMPMGAATTKRNFCYQDSSFRDQLIQSWVWKWWGRSLHALLSHPLMHAVKQETLPVTSLLGCSTVFAVVFFSCLAVIFPERAVTHLHNGMYHYMQFHTLPERDRAQTDITQYHTREKNRSEFQIQHLPVQLGICHQYDIFLSSSEHMPLHAWDKIGQRMTSSVSLLTHFQETGVLWQLNLER